MKKLMCRVSKTCTLRTTAAALVLLLGLAPLHQASAQSFCASDGQPLPVLLMERFINADCPTCWQDPATPQARAEHAVLDWVVPNDAGSKGDDAPLSVVANRDGLARLETLSKTLPQDTLTSTQLVAGLQGLNNRTTLRVAHGLPVSGYLGVSIELKPVPQAARKQHWTAWLALVETLAPGTEGTPVARSLVRNAFQVAWHGEPKPLKTGQNRFFEARSMRIAPGVNPDQLRLVGWVEDAKGRVLLTAQSACAN